MTDTLDVLTLGEAKSAINATGESDPNVESELGQVITAASRVLDRVYGPVVSRQRTWSVLAPQRYGPIVLDDVPVSSRTFAVTVDSVTEYDQGVATVLTAETATVAGTYRFDSRTGRIYRRSSWRPWHWPAQEVVVVYTAGRAANTAAVDEGMKEAAAVVVAHLWQHRGAGSGAAVPGGEGPMFGAVPFSSKVLRDKLRALYPDECLTPGLA